MPIHRSGYLKMHPKFPLAQIVYVNGNMSQTLVTKRQALEIGEAMRDVGVISPEEWLAIRQQIHQSDLCDKSVQLEQMCDELQGDLEELKRQIEKFTRLEKHRDTEGEDWKSE